MSFNSYIAGLGLTESQTLNGLAWASTIGMFYLTWPGSDFQQKVEREAGKAVHMPPGKSAQIVSMTHGMALFLPAGAFLFSLPPNRFEMPGWLLKTALPPPSEEMLYYGLRLGGCAGVLGVGATMVWTFKHLGSQWNYIGVRERPKLVKTGPYAIVRHPMYICAMLNDVLFSAMFWNWMPLVGAAIMAAMFAIKMPMEEKVILDNEEVGEAYRRYKKEVPWRVIPYIW
ncbi:hypothetical protein FS749_013466 [Ceratobasidium sp. UAMH 11750]|nr:hypothetical protein FS749_013466 [Ceratobasidium sp. UAMH 11750]